MLAVAGYDKCKGRGQRVGGDLLPSRPTFLPRLDRLKSRDSYPSGEPLGGQRHFEPWHKWLSICKRIKSGPYLMPCIITNSRWIKGLCIRYKILRN